MPKVPITREGWRFLGRLLKAAGYATREGSGEISLLRRLKEEFYNLDERTPKKLTSLDKIELGNLLERVALKIKRLNPDHPNPAAQERTLESLAALGSLNDPAIHRLNKELFEEIVDERTGRINYGLFLVRLTASEPSVRKYPRGSDNGLALKEEAQSFLGKQASVSMVPSGLPAHAIEPLPSNFQTREEVKWALAKNWVWLSDLRGFRIGILGQRGAGKKTLARSIAHEGKKLFPDGGIEVSMCTPSGESVPVVAILAKIIEHFRPHYRPHLLPLSADELELAKQLREVLRGRATLVLLKDLVSSEQLYPLAKYAIDAGCGVLFTSRSTLVRGKRDELGFKEIIIPLASPSAAEKLALSIAGKKKGFSGSNQLFSKQFGYQLWAVHEAATTVANDVAGALDDLKRQLVLNPLKLLKVSGAQFEGRHSQINRDLQKAWRFLSVFSCQFSADGAATILNSWKGDPGRSREMLNELVELGLVKFYPHTAQFEILPQDRMFLRGRLTRMEREIVIRQLATHLAVLDDQLITAEHDEDLARVTPWAVRYSPANGCKLFRRSCKLLKRRTAIACALRVANLSEDEDELHAAASTITRFCEALETEDADTEVIIPLWEAALDIGKRFEPNTFLLKCLQNRVDRWRRFASGIDKRGKPRPGEETPLDGRFFSKDPQPISESIPP